METLKFGRINNGNAFADFIVQNDLYVEGEFFEYYEQYLQSEPDECFVDDFMGRMDEHGRQVNY